jgi:hypothetical protein
MPCFIKEKVRDLYRSCHARGGYAPALRAGSPWPAKKSRPKRRRIPPAGSRHPQSKSATSDIRTRLLNKKTPALFKGEGGSCALPSGTALVQPTVILRGLTASDLGRWTLSSPCSMEALILLPSMLGSRSNTRRYSPALRSR